MPASLFAMRGYYEPMETRAAYTIEKPSFWQPRRELRDASHGKAGYFVTTSAWTSKAEGEAHGRKYLFAPKSMWDLRRAVMTDASGQEVAHAEPKDWWGKSTLHFGGIEYTWTPETWYSGFTLSQGDTKIAHVRIGGYFKPGVIQVFQGSAKELLPALLFGMYYSQLYANQAAAASGAGVYSS
jgi:hypothetical protein